MPNSKNIIDEVNEVLNRNPCIRMNMGKGLINIRALARYIIKERKLETTLDAVISAIRRYEMKSEEKLFENAYDIITKTIAISTKTPLASISLIKDTEVQGLLPKLFSIIHYNQGDVLRIIQADESIKIIVDEKNLENAKNLFPEGKINRIKRNLGEINAHMHPDGEHVLGIVAITLNELAINGINVQETMSCVPEVVCFVEEKDILKAYNVLHNLWNPHTKYS